MDMFRRAIKDWVRHKRSDTARKSSDPSSRSPKAKKARTSISATPSVVPVQAAAIDPSTPLQAAADEQLSCPVQPSLSLADSVFSRGDSDDDSV